MIHAHALTISILTIPERADFLRRLFASILALKLATPPRVDVVYNRALNEPLGDVQARIHDFAPTLPVDVYFNAAETSIAAGRNLQLSVCRSPLIAFVDDDLSLHGNIVATVLETLAAHPIALVGFPSYDGDSIRQIKPRDSTPAVDWRGLKFMPVQGMLCAGYRALLADVGGFNQRRRYWGEWTELNLRLWRSGFPTAYQMRGGLLRHWMGAPTSPTRNLQGRERHVVWGLICTALEYDAVDITEATEVFWRLVEDRYLAYSYGDDLSPKNLLKTVLELVPQLSSEWGSIQAFREKTIAHPFQFAPFHRFTLDQVQSVYAHAETAIERYRHAPSLTHKRETRALTVPHVPASLKNALGRLLGSLKTLRNRV